MSFEPHPFKSTTTSEPRRPAEAGSAYLAALLVLVLLTIIGLSLSLVTQTEMQIGANEKTIERAFYAADSGIALATARTLVTRSPSWSAVYEIDDPENKLISHRLDVSPFFPISRAPCNLCDVNNAGEYGAKNYYRANHAVVSIAIRRLPGSQVPLAEKGVGAMVEFQPWELTPHSHLAVQDERQLEEVGPAL